jgi:hypothetical protein
MEVYHATTKPVSRSSGRSAVAAAAYPAGEKKTSVLASSTTKKQGKEGDCAP